MTTETLQLDILGKQSYCIIEGMVDMLIYLQQE